MRLGLGLGLPPGRRNISGGGGQPEPDPPILSSATAAAISDTAASLSVDTDQDNGTLYWIVTTSSTGPSKAQVKAGQDHAGAAAADAGSQAVSATGAQNVSGGATGLAANTIYYAHFMHENTAVEQSTVASSAAFTTDAELWEPDELGSDLLLWLKGDDLSGNDQDNIAAWNDASGNSRDFTQATEELKPNLEVAELNGLNVLRFTKANNENLVGPSLAGILTSGSVFCVVRTVAEGATINNAGPLHFGSGGTSHHYTFTDENIYNGDLSNARKTVGNPTPSVVAWNISGVTSAASDWKYYLNGAQLFTTATNTVGLSTSPQIGRSVGQNLDGYVAEVILMNGVPPQAIREKLEGYAAHKWGIASVLDAAHPYKSSAPIVGGDGGGFDPTYHLLGF